MKVYFVGAGPGDPELLTLKGARILASSPVIIYTGSLVNPDILRHAPPGAEIYDSSGMTLEQIIAVMVESVKRGKTVARVHTGDPSLYGALQEQLERLEELGVEYEIVPGVSSLAAAAASVRREYTLPGIAQTVIITRAGGRTPVPEKEALAELARHGTTLCLFLSVQAIEEVAGELLKGYPPQTPVAVVEKASWPEERVVRGTLADIAGKVRQAGINRTALILVGDFLRGGRVRSRLYDGTFSHRYRSGGVAGPASGGKKGECPGRHDSGGGEGE